MWHLRLVIHDIYIYTSISVVHILGMTSSSHPRIRWQTPPWHTPGVTPSPWCGDIHHHHRHLLINMKLLASCLQMKPSKSREDNKTNLFWFCSVVFVIDKFPLRAGNVWCVINWICTTVRVWKWHQVESEHNCINTVNLCQDWQLSVRSMVPWPATSTSYRACHLLVWLRTFYEHSFWYLFWYWTNCKWSVCPPVRFQDINTLQVRQPKLPCL